MHFLDPRHCSRNRSHSTPPPPPTKQAHGVHLGAAELLVVAFTASLAAVGAPAIPSAGLVTMLVVLQAVGLERFAPGEAGVRGACCA